MLTDEGERLLPMQMLTRWEDLPPEPHVITIGNFDGVHRGHRTLLELVRQRAHDRGSKSLVITFDPLPAEVLSPDQAPPRLTLTEHRLALIGSCGIDRLLLIRFDHAFAALSPDEFVSLLVRAAHPVEIVVGDDFHFGRGRSGNPAVLQALGQRFNFAVTVVSRVSDGQSTISSTRIRQALRTGEVTEAANLLGRPHVVVGTVVPGAGRGTQLGFPTANLAIHDRLLTPADGIYAAVSCVFSRWHPALVYVGERPTFPGAGRAVEVYLLSTPPAPLLGSVVSVYFVERLRPDQAFDSVERLTEQMREDERRARAILTAKMTEWPPPLVALLQSALEGALPVDADPSGA